MITLPEDLIIGFPADSGIKPIYVMFRDPRDVPGAATGKGQPVSGNWLGAASQGEGLQFQARLRINYVVRHSKTGGTFGNNSG